MEGIEILSYWAVNKISITPIIFGCFIIILFSVGLGASLVDVDEGGVLVCMLGAVIGLSILLIPIGELGSKEAYIKYEIKVSEEVNMVEFHEKYEILDREGNVFTVREKEVIQND